MLIRAVKVETGPPFVMVLLAFSVIGLLHVSCWAEFPPDVDPINFRMSLEQYDVSTDAPHPPGYPLFVGLARAAESLVGPAYAFQLVNFVLLLWTGVALYLAMRAVGQADVGFAAGIIATSSPLAWSATVVSESYMSDAAFAASTLLVMATFRHSKWAASVAMPLLYLFFSLFRVVTGALLLPFAVGGIYLLASDRSWRRAALTGAGCLAASVIAYAITIQIAGGFDVYQTAANRVMGAAFRSSSVLGGASLLSHLEMATKAVAWFVFWALPALAALTVVGRRGRLFGLQETQIIVWLAGLLFIPVLIFYTTIYFLKPQYHLILLPALSLLFAIAVFQGVATRRSLRWQITGGLAVAQLLFYTLGPTSLPAPLRRFTHGYFRGQDAAWRDLMADLELYRSTDVPLVWSGHPSLGIYATRLLAWDGPIVIQNSESAQAPVSFLDPTSMKWSTRCPPRRLSSLAVHVGSGPQGAVLRSLEFPYCGSHRRAVSRAIRADVVRDIDAELQSKPGGRRNADSAPTNRGGRRHHQGIQ